ncbi:MULTISPECIES: hypothetical protein [Vibrio]|uniref:hypothetical protein n=1 Tax=Vibrio TaxID=662 RepID=UPI0001B9509B|nr:hypothetical protein [Vibrio sp. SCSIO 43169]EEX31495.1 hypothetical protein VIC_004443 [Vibrio coralliilyticus ATCC BAA-450]
MKGAVIPDEYTPFLRIDVRSIVRTASSDALTYELTANGARHSFRIKYLII